MFALWFPMRRRGGRAEGAWQLWKEFVEFVECCKESSWRYYWNVGFGKKDCCDESDECHVLFCLVFAFFEIIFVVVVVVVVVVDRTSAKI